MAITVHVSPSAYNIEIGHIPGYGSVVITPQTALNILARLSERRTDITNLARDYYECDRCSGVHRNGKDCNTHEPGDLPKPTIDTH